MDRRRVKDDESCITDRHNATLVSSVSNLKPGRDHNEENEIQDGDEETTIYQRDMPRRKKQEEVIGGKT